jgi:hypothetical protein
MIKNKLRMLWVPVLISNLVFCFSYADQLRLHTGPGGCANYFRRVTGSNGKDKYWIDSRRNIVWSDYLVHPNGERIVTPVQSDAASICARQFYNYSGRTLRGRLPSKEELDSLRSLFTQDRSIFDSIFPNSQPFDEYTFWSSTVDPQDSRRFYKMTPWYINVDDSKPYAALVNSVYGNTRRYWGPNSYEPFGIKCVFDF